MKLKWTNLACFNPFVMATTFVIEIFLFILVILKASKKDLKTKLVLVALLMLAAFQGTEYMLCKTDGSDELWARVGFVVITVLPPVGIHLTATVSKVKNSITKILVPLAYLTGLVWIVVFGFGFMAFDSYGCATNYAIFDLSGGYSFWYQVYYYGWLTITLLLANYLAKLAKTKDVRNRLTWIIIGYLSFMIPTIIFYYVNLHLSYAIPSVLCGFAVGFALILVFGIVKPTKKRKRQRK